MKGWLDKYQEGGKKNAKVNLEDVYTKLGISAKNFIDPMAGATASSDVTRTIKPAEAKRFEIRRDQLNPTGYKNEELSKFYKEKDRKKKAIQKAGETFQTIGAFTEPLALIPTPITETIGIIGGIANAVGSSTLAANDISEGNYLDAFGNLAMGATSLPALSFANPSNVRSLATNLPKARSFKEGIGAAFANITPNTTLPRMTSQELKTARGIQDIGRLRATGAPKSKQIQKALDLNLSEDQFIRSFGISRDEAMNSLTNSMPVQTVTNQTVTNRVVSDEDRDLMNALFGRRSTTAERDRLNQIFQESEGLPASRDFDDATGLSSSDVDSTDFEMPQSLRDRIANIGNARTQTGATDPYTQQRDRLAEVRERIANLTRRQELSASQYNYGTIDPYTQLLNSSSSNFDLLSGREKLQKSIEDATRNFIHPYESYSGPISDKLGYLSMDKSGKQGARNAVQRALENVQNYSNKGEVITGSLNTSHNSYLPQLKTIFGEAKNLGNPVFLGNEEMNTMGFLSNFGYSQEDIARYMNSEIDELIKRGKVPKDIMRPTYVPETNSVQLPHYGIRKTTDPLLDNPFNDSIDLPFKNGGIVQENYNDYSVSAPEGYVGVGTFNKGRNYSPAWGGQFQKGGKVPATKADSIALLNNTQALADYYKKKGYKKLEHYRDSDGEWNIDIGYKKIARLENKQNKKPTEKRQNKIDKIQKKVTDIRESINEDNRYHNPQNYLTNLNRAKQAFDKARFDYNNDEKYGYIDEEGKYVAAKPSSEQYYKSIDANRFGQRDQSFGFMDLGAPMPLFDRRITPQNFVRYETPEGRNYQNTVEFYGYDPLAVTPWNMIPPEQQQERVETYGTSGAPADILQQHPDWVVPTPVPEVKPKDQPKYRYTYGKPLFKGGPQTDYYTPIDEAGNVISTPEFKTPEFQNGGYLNEYNKKHPPIYVSNPKDSRIGKYSAAGNQYLYKKSVQPTAKKPQPTPKSVIDWIEGKDENAPTRLTTSEDYAMGGSIPGAVGFTYARTIDPAPSNGKYAKKTMASAQDGKEVPKEIPKVTTTKFLPPIIRPDEEVTKPEPKLEKEIPFISSPDPEPEYIAPVEPPVQVEEIYVPKKASSNVPKKSDNIYRTITKKDVEEVKNSMINYINSPLYRQRLNNYPEKYYGDAYSYQKKKYETAIANNKVKERPKQLRNVPYEFINGDNSFNTVLNLVTLSPKNNSLSVIAHELGHAGTRQSVDYDPKNKIDNDFESRIVSDYNNGRYWDSVVNKTKLNSFNIGLNEKEVQEFVNRAKPLSENLRNENEGDAHWTTEGTDPLGFAQESYGDLMGVRELLYKNGYTKKFGDPIDKKLLDKARKDKRISNNHTFSRFYQKHGEDNLIHLNNTIAANNPQQGMPMAQNGMEMKYYQDGLDFKPKSISKNGKKVIKDDMGQWAHPGEITEIGSNQITMQGVPYPVLGISNTGDTQMMYPNEEYEFIGDSVTEYPMMKQGGQLTKLDQLLNFTNYNTKQPGGWLDKYQ